MTIAEIINELSDIMLEYGDLEVGLINLGAKNQELLQIFDMDIYADEAGEFLVLMTDKPRPYLALVEDKQD